MEKGGETYETGKVCIYQLCLKGNGSRDQSLQISGRQWDKVLDCAAECKCRQ